MTTATATSNGTASSARSKLMGRMVIGKYTGCVPVQKRDGTVVRGMHELQVTAERSDGQDWTYRLTFFDTDQEGEPTRMRQQFDAVSPQEGEIVAVAFRSRASVSGGKNYVNDTATGIARLTSRS